MTDDGPAGRAGVMVGDKLMSVNSTSLSEADHHDAVKALKEAGYDITMVICREVLVPATDKPVST